MGGTSDSDRRTYNVARSEHTLTERVDEMLLQEERSGVYEDEEGNVRAYALCSPKDPSKRRTKTELDLYLPKENETWAVPGEL
jgi:hypothetical protein